MWVEERIWGSERRGKMVQSRLEEESFYILERRLRGEKDCQWPTWMGQGRASV